MSRISSFERISLLEFVSGLLRNHMPARKCSTHPHHLSDMGLSLFTVGTVSSIPFLIYLFFVVCSGVGCLYTLVPDGRYSFSCE